MSEAGGATPHTPRPVFTEHEVAAGNRARNAELLGSLGIGAVLAIGWFILLAAAGRFHLRTYRDVPWWLELLVYVLATRALLSAVAVAGSASQRDARRRAGIQMRPNATFNRALVLGQLLELTISVVLALAMWGIARTGEWAWLLALPVPYVLWFTLTASTHRMFRLQLPLEPLHDERCLTMLDELAAHAGVAAPRAELLRSSAWSQSVNAAVVRAGREDALIVFDTALDLPDAQLRALLAHELGHVARSDARAAATVVALVSASTIALAFTLLPYVSFLNQHEIRLDATAAEPIDPNPFSSDPAAQARLAPCRSATGRLDFDCYEALVHPHGSTPYRGLPLAYVDLAGIAFGLTAAGAIARGRWQRRRERDADAFALDLTRDPAAFVGLVRSLTVSAGAAVGARGIGCTHASAAQRIELARAWVAAHATPDGDQSSGT